MTFFKLAALSIVVQGFAGSVLGALVIGIIVGQPLTFLSGGVSSLAYLFLAGALASLFPSLAIAGVLAVVVAKTTRRGGREALTVGTALVSGAIWAALGLALGRYLVSDPSLWKVVVALAASGVISGAVVGFYASRLKERHVFRATSSR